jgi:hypothetical protein
MTANPALARAGVEVRLRRLKKAKGQDREVKGRETTRWVKQKTK